MRPIAIDDIDTLSRWLEVSDRPNDNAISGYIRELEGAIGDLVVFEDDHAPSYGAEPSEEYVTLNRITRMLALLRNDMKAIRREVSTARLLNEKE